MEVLFMRLYWKIGEVGLTDSSFVALESHEIDIAIEEADRIWLKSKDNLDPQPAGYLIYDGASAKIVYERRLETPTLTEVRPSSESATPAKSVLRNWRWPWSR